MAQVAAAWTVAHSARIFMTEARRRSLSWSISAARGTKGRTCSATSSFGLSRSPVRASSRRLGWTMPGASGQGSSGGPRAVWKWLDTITPSMGSTGWLGHQPMTWDLRPCWLRMFQIALVVRA